MSWRMLLVLIIMLSLIFVLEGEGDGEGEFEVICGVWSYSVDLFSFLWRLFCSSADCGVARLRKRL